MLTVFLILIGSSTAGRYSKKGRKDKEQKSTEQPPLTNLKPNILSSPPTQTLKQTEKTDTKTIDDVKTPFVKRALLQNRSPDNRKPKKVSTPPHHHNAPPHHHHHHEGPHHDRHHPPPHHHNGPPPPPHHGPHHPPPPPPPRH